MKPAEILQSTDQPSEKFTDTGFARMAFLGHAFRWFEAWEQGANRFPTKSVPEQEQQFPCSTFHGYISQKVIEEHSTYVHFTDGEIEASDQAIQLGTWQI